MNFESNQAVTIRDRVRFRGAFTLVEFLVAVLFVATVVALAVPRLWNSGSEARAAKQQAIFGSVRAAAQITRASAQVHNQTGANGSVVVDGITISTVYGYPAATPAGIVAATGLDLANDQVTLSGGGTQPGATITISLEGSRGNCAILYAAPNAADALPSIGTLDTDSDGHSGC